MAEKIIVPRRPEDWFEIGTDKRTGKPTFEFTLRAFRFFEAVTDITNTNTSDIEDDSGIGALNALVLRLQEQVGSGKPLTIDTTGFTVDTTKQFTDQTEA